MQEYTHLHKLDPHANYIRPVAAVLVTDYCNLAILIVLLVLSKSNFYAFFFLLPFLIQHVFLLYALFKHKEWKKEDFNLSEFTLFGTAQVFNSSPTTLYLTRWLAVRHVIFFVLFVCWFRSLWLYGQVLGVNYGLGISFAGKSSCTTAYQDANGVFNPYGSFDRNNIFSWDRSYVQCVFDDVTWANPSPLSSHRVTGYNKFPPWITLDCSNPLNSGFVSLSECPLSQSYPDLTLGVETPVITGTTTASVEYCPGNANNEVVCYDPTNTFIIPCTSASSTTSRVPGKPYKICPACLNYIRGMSDFQFIDSDFSQCADYEASERWDWFCMWCPGMGSGWLGAEVASTNEVIVNFWLATTSIMILYPFQYALFLGVYYLNFH